MVSDATSGRAQSILRFVVILLFIVFAAVVRGLPHPWNFTPIGAMALFSGAKLGRSPQAFLYPLAALFVGDIFVGFHKLMAIVYLSFVANILIGSAIRRRQTPSRIALATLLGAIQFYLVTNFAMWAIGTTYAKNFAGLITCYLAAIPFFWNTLAGDAFYAVILFAGFALLEHFYPAIAAEQPLSERWMQPRA